MERVTDRGDGSKSASWRVWLERADAALLVDMPRRGRVIVEIAFLVVLVLGAHANVQSVPVTVAVLLTEAAVAVFLLRPWVGQGRGLGERGLALLIALLAVAAPALAEGPGSVGAQRRLGVELVTSDSPSATTDGSSGIAEVKAVIPGTPAEGLLRPGDRIVAVNGAALARDLPNADLTRRIQSNALPEDTTVSVLRDGAVTLVPVHVPRASPAARPFGALSALAADHLVVATAVRDAVLIVFLLLLVRVDGQRLSALGAAGGNLRREIGPALAATAGVFGVQIAAAIPIALLGALAGLANREASHRVETLGRLAGQGSAPEFLVALVVAASFEEIAFRAFLTPRLRTLTGSWISAAIVVSLVFGAGHFYEGTMAVFQTAVLGLYFTAIYVWRKNLLAVIVSHATFNAIMFVLVGVLSHSHAVESLKTLGPP
jgi:membrane protease YdiL (CAAX protease family)